MTIALTTLEKACCEAMWRSAVAHGPLSAPLWVDPSRPQARRELADIVRGLPAYVVATITMREIERYGRLEGGYSLRWEDRYLSPPYPAPPAGPPCPPCPLDAPTPRGLFGGLAATAHQRPALIDEILTEARRVSVDSTECNTSDSDTDDASQTQAGSSPR